MKKLFPLLLIAAIFFVGCEKENVAETSNTDAQFSLDQQSLINDIDNLNSDTQRGSQDMEELERFSHWAGFILVQTIMDGSNPADLNHFSNSLDASNVVSINDLLSDSHFNNSYTSYVQSMILCGGNPCYPGTAGDPPPGPFGGNGAPVQTQVQLFMDYITIDNCLEVFVPGGLNLLSDPFEATSTAHPLSNQSANEGYARTVDPIRGKYSHYVAVVDQNYVNSNNVIVVRPVHALINPNCDYSQYGVTNNDFTQFLND